jgi:hypothetical protein
MAFHWITGLDDAVGEMTRVLEPHTGVDWHEVRAGSLDWSCWTTAAHVAHDLLAYAGQVAARPDDGYLPFDLTVRVEATPTEALQVVTACVGLLRAALTTANADLRAWHYGPCDPVGFAAMGIAETLVHTWDITRGLGIDWRPPTEPSRAVLGRLFPDAPADDPEVLLWATGRGELDGYARRTSWSWRAAVS